MPNGSGRLQSRDEDRLVAKANMQKERSIEKREKYYMIVKDHPEGDVYTHKLKNMAKALHKSTSDAVAVKGEEI